MRRHRSTSALRASPFSGVSVGACLDAAFVFIRVDSWFLPVEFGIR
jgi:hypothetical protein